MRRSWMLVASWVVAVAGCSAASNDVGGDGGGGGTADGGAGDGSVLDAGPAMACAALKSSMCPSGKAVLALPAVSPYIDDADITAMAAADFDGDGKADIVLSHSDRYLEILINKGDGTLKAGVKLEESVAGYGLAAADFTGDCKADVLISSFAGTSQADHFNVHEGHGDGTFAVTGIKTDINNENVTNLRVADFNGDHRPDALFVGNGTFSAGPSIILNTGGGSFAGPGAPVAGLVNVFDAGDVTGDGVPDIVSVVYGAQMANGMCVRANNGNANFAPPVCYPISDNLQASFVAVGDVNGDGKNDVVVAGADASGSNDRTFNVFINKGDGTFKDRVPYGWSGTSVQALRIVDVNGDGKGDIVIFGSSGGASLFVFSNKGDGTFDTASPLVSPVSTDAVRAEELLVVGDYKGNGLPGFAVLDRHTNQVKIYAGDCKP